MDKNFTLDFMPSCSVTMYVRSFSQWVEVGACSSAQYATRLALLNVLCHIAPHRDAQREPSMECRVATFGVYHVSAITMPVYYDKTSGVWICSGHSAILST